MIFAGCYERFIFGYKPSSDIFAVQDGALERKYTFAAHKNTVKCMATSGNFLVSGGADDTIHLYDLKRDKDMGFLMNPGEGAVPCLEFFTPDSSPTGTPSHLFSGSADGAIVVRKAGGIWEHLQKVWKAGGNWEHLKKMRGHKGSVNSLSVHPSGRLALSTAR
eukprot:gene5250-18481_t